MPELEQKTFQKRQIAYKVRVSDILNGIFIKDGISAGYVRLNDAIVSRVNLIATVVYKSEQQSAYASAIVDDGTGKILLRSFENANFFSKVDVGDAVLVIGKIREFNDERYVLPEIFKKINNPAWMNLRAMELKNLKIIEKDIIKNENKPVIEQVVSNIAEDIYLLIKTLDNGDGVPIDAVINNSNSKNPEELINKLLEIGDVFEIKPGRLKVLE